MNIKINTFDPGEFNSWFNIVVEGVEYDVNYDHDKPRRTEILRNGDEVDLPNARVGIIERLDLFLTFFDSDALKREIISLTDEANGAMEQHLVQVKESGW
jgi:hypothetical protein